MLDNQKIEKRIEYLEKEIEYYSDTNRTIRTTILHLAKDGRIENLKMIQHQVSLIEENLSIIELHKQELSFLKTL